MLMDKLLRERCTLLVIEKCEVRTTVRYDHIPTGAFARARHNQNPHIAGENRTRHNRFGKFGSFLKSNIHLADDAAISQLGIDSRHEDIGSHKDVYMKAHSSFIHNREKQKEEKSNLLSAKRQVISCLNLGVGVGLTEKGTLRGDGNILFFHCGSSYVSLLTASTY